MYLLLLIPALLYGVAAQEELLPGVLKAERGTVFLVEDVVTVRLDLTPLWSTAPSVEAVLHCFDNLTSLLRTYRFSTHSYALENQMVLAARISMMTPKISTIRSLLPEKPSLYHSTLQARRTKRGLINGLGYLSKYLFGTAMADDVEQLSQHIGAIDGVLANHERTIKATHVVLKEFTKKVQEIILVTNNLTQAVEEIETDLFHTNLRQYWINSISALEIAVEDTLATFHNFIAGLVDAGRSRVTTNLFPLHLLKESLNYAVVTFKLEPLFQPSSLEYYYPLLKSALSHSGIVIQIPMKSAHSFTLYEIRSFPFLLGKTILTFKSTSRLILISDDLSLTADTEETALSQCSTTYLHLYVCPAFLFSFQPLSRNSCEFNLLLKNQTSIVTTCDYRTEETRTFYHTHFFTSHYLFFPKSTGITLTCLTNTSFQRVVGHFRSPDACEVRSDVVIALPSRHHLAFVSTFTPELQKLSLPLNLSLSDVSIHSSKIDFLQMLSDPEISSTLTGQVLPHYVSRPFLIAVVGLPTLVLLASTVIFTYCIFGVYRRYRRLRARRRLPTAEVQDEENGSVQGESQSQTSLDSQH